MTQITMPETVRALAEADFSAVAQRFAAAGFAVNLPAPGILQIGSGTQRVKPMSLLLSVGVHGDETGPIEMLAHLLAALAESPQQLALDLMVVVGNPAAIAQGRRFIDADLNRLFLAERGELASVAEAARADAIMQASAAFFAGADANAQKWHLDLHTAIRRSHYPTFAIVPEPIADADRQALTHFLGHAAIEAMVISPKSAGTYTAWTARQFGTVSATLELGQVGTLGNNDLSLFIQPKAALDALLRADVQVLSEPVAGSLPHGFRVAQEIVKLSDDFRMAFDRSTQNFTALQQGAVIASDGATVYRVQHAEEFVVFPNPDVRIGFRAGLMVVRES
ncbi:MAG: succinylglutamate desuccinylase [Oxalobacteraceae bacterium]|nr:succinylglutamate desuccinylase [Oxalobacteraceae bacterium]